MVRQSLFKFAISVVLFLGVGLPSHGQLLDTLYYNEFWQLVPRDSATHFRIAEIDTVNLWFTGKFRDYYSDSTVLMEGQYAKSGMKNGPFKIYYPSGQAYCTGYFDNDQLSGVWEYFNEQGKLKERVRFTGFDFQIIDSYDAEGTILVKNGTGKWVKNFIAGDGSTLTAQGRYYNTKREGNWKLKNQEGRTLLNESYSNDYFIQGTVLYPELSYYQESKFTSALFYPNSLRAIESFTVWEAMRSDYPYLKWLPVGQDSTRGHDEIVELPDRSAHYPLGMQTFHRKVSQIVVYPEIARARKIEGKVYVEFIVGTDGYVYDAHLLRGIGGGCDQQAVIAILAAGRWFPAQKNGFPVEQRVVIPVTFRLEQ